MIASLSEHIHISLTVNVEGYDAKSNVHSNTAVDGWPVVDMLWRRLCMDRARGVRVLIVFVMVMVAMSSWSSDTTRLDSILGKTRMIRHAVVFVGDYDFQIGYISFFSMIWYVWKKIFLMMRR